MKTFLLDTNVLLYDPASLKVFSDNEVVIPLPVLDELDGTKSRLDEVGRNARLVIRMLDDLRKSGSLSEGVKLNESIIRVELNHCGNLPSSLAVDKVDNRIISSALGLKQEGKQVIVVSKDINLRVKCDALGLEAQDYAKGKIADHVSLIFTGVEVLSVPSTTIDKLYSDGFIETDLEAHPNQFFYLKSDEKENHVGISRFIKGKGNYKNKLVPLKKLREIMNITPRNLEQKMAMDLLLDPNIKLVTLIGKAGSGKTLMAVAAALHHVLTDCKTYDRVLISRPIQPMGRDLGFLPGDIDEKLKPWMQPIYDNLELVLGSEYRNSSMYEGLIQVEPLTYIRGRSIPKSYIILDEAQNLSSQEIKTIITRVGEHTKIVITGDIEQIDNPYVDFADNGLTHVVEKFKEHEIAGHITLTKGERSELATLASEIL
ncbi:MAG: PhoH family protein [Patescibacteria group bacterium]